MVLTVFVYIAPWR